MIRAWDGKLESLEEDLETVFKDVIEYIYLYHLHQGGSTSYLGEGVLDFLATHKESGLVLKNPWHVIALRYLSTEQAWRVYDPNFVNGSKMVREEALEEVIENALGRLISVGETCLNLPRISDPDAFLSQGGLLALEGASNVISMLDVLPSPKLHAYSKKALEGLFFYPNIEQFPAWVRGLKSLVLKSFTLSLLEQFCKGNRDALERLKASLPSSYMPVEVSTLFDTIELSPVMQTLKKQLRPSTEKEYEQQLQTWKTQIAEEITVTQYCQHLVEGKTKRLIELDSPEALEGLQLNVLHYCQSISRPVFCVNSPSDLVCSSPYIAREGEVGFLHQAPGGPLYDFLQAHPDGVLLVNYDAFKADDIVHFNALLEKVRYADGEKIPETTLILGLICPSRLGAYRGGDLYSRFGRKCIERCSFPVEAFLPVVPKFPKEVSLENRGECEVIELCGALNWKEQLLGEWVIQGDSLLFHAGALKKALATKKTIHIQNGLWEDAEFRQFWQQACIKGVIEYEGERLEIPKEVRWTRGEGYRWSSLLEQTNWDKQLHSEGFILNSHQLADFFRQYECDTEKGTLITLPGLLERHTEKDIEVNVTSKLSENEWGLFLLECKKYHVQPHFHVACGVHLPNAFPKEGVSVKAEIPYWDGRFEGNPLVLESSDVSATVALLSRENEAVVIEISECTAPELLSYLDGECDEKTLRFNFWKEIGAIQQGLSEGKKIILHGEFSQTLMEGLAALLLSKEHAGQMILVSNSAQRMNYCMPQRHEVSVKEKKACLARWKYSPEEEKHLACYWDKESYAQLLARLHCIRASGIPADELAFSFSDKAWEGLREISAKPLLEIVNFDTPEAAEQSDNFLKERYRKVDAVLEHAPYVFLTGPTG